MLDTQQAIARWAAATFPDHTVERVALGLGEECGEVLRAVLKRRDGIRGSYASWTAELRKEIGDVAIRLLELCHLEGWAFEEVVAERWATIRHRDVNHDALMGRDPDASAIAAEAGS